MNIIFINAKEPKREEILCVYECEYYDKSQFKIYIHGQTI